MLPGEKEVRPVEAFLSYAKNTGGSNELAVDGSTIPIRFEVKFPNYNLGRDFKLLEVVLVIGGGGRLDTPENFGGLNNPLVNGLTLGWLVSASQHLSVLETLVSIKSNYDLICFSSSSKPWGFTAERKDVLVARFFGDFEPTFNAKRIIGLYIDIQDDLTDIDSMRLSVRGHIV